MSMRVIFEARVGGNVHRVELDVRDDNWLDELRNAAERRQGIVEAANALMRGLNLDEIVEAQ